MNALVAILAISVSPPPPVDFDTEVVPILTKAGCNAAACHGSTAGRGGFKLSLFGGDPGWDYDEIVHRMEGRRVNLAIPESSLLIAKPTEQIEHGGGNRFEYEGADARRLTRWIARGARRIRARRLTQIEVDPGKIEVVNKCPTPGTRQDLRSCMSLINQFRQFNQAVTKKYISTQAVIVLKEPIFLATGTSKSI